jgi:uncharacterized repeat protein (TIGR02543 family)
LDLTGFDTTNVINITNIFGKCTNLKVIATTDEKVIKQASSILGSTLTFNTSDGNFSDGTTSKTSDSIKTVPSFKKEDLNAVINDILDTMEKPAREGYIFNGWTTDNTSNNPEDILNATYTATWRTNTSPSIETLNNQTYFKVEYGKDINISDYFIISDMETSYEDLEIEITENIEEKVGVYEVNCTVVDSDNNTVTKTIEIEIYLPNWNYTIDNDENIVLSEYTGAESILNIEGIMGGRDTIITLNLFNKLKDSTVTNLSIKETDGKKVSISGQSLKQAFYENKNIKSIDLSGLDASNITNMSYMFADCNNLTTLNLSEFDTSEVTNMSYMFSGCISLISLDITSFNTGEVSDMARMFRSCSNLTTLDLSKFNTSKVTNMAYMFSNCAKLISLDLSSFDTSAVNTIDDMFDGCNNLKIVATSSSDVINEIDKILGSTITFNANNGKFSNNKTLKTSVIKTVPDLKVETINNIVENILNNMEEPTRKGYIFDGWSTDNTSDNVEDILNSTYTAKWSKIISSENEGNNVKPPNNNENNSDSNSDNSNNNLNSSNSSNTSTGNSSNGGSNSADKTESNNASNNNVSDSVNVDNINDNDISNNEDSNKDNDRDDNDNNNIDKGISDIEDNNSDANNEEIEKSHNNSRLLIASSSIIAGIRAYTLHLRRKNKKD